MSRTRLLARPSVLAFVALGALAQPALASGGKPAIESFGESSVMPTEVTLEAVIDPEGSETSYQLRTAWFTCTGLRKEKHAGDMCTAHEAVVDTGTLPARDEPQTVSVTIPVEEGSEYFYGVQTSNERGNSEADHYFQVPGGPGTGQPWLESLTASEITSKSAKIEATFDLEASSGSYEFNQECECSKTGSPKELAYGTITGASGTETRVAKAKLKPHRTYRITFHLANGAATKGEEVSFETP